MKKLISIVLSLLLVCSLIPMAAFADTDTPEEPSTAFSSRTDRNKGKKPDGNKKDDDDKKGDGGWKDRDHHHKKDKDKKKGHGTRPVLHNHEYNGYGSNPTYHWLQCACGCRINVEPHVDPLETDDNYCFCGYHFSDNADLVTLWIAGCPPIKGFNKNKTEYTLDAYTYKDVKEIKVSTRTFDSEATVELPEDLTLKEGENKFEIKVTAENQKVTKVYTVIVNKEAKK